MENLSIYDKLSNRMKESMLIGSSLGILGWDIKTYMPPAGIGQRGQTMGVLSKILHEHFTSDITGNLLKESSKLKDLTNIQERNIFLWQRDYDKETKLPVELVQELSKQRNLTDHIWEQAKKKANFKLVQPDLEKLYALVKKKAELLDPDKWLYDNLLDLYEPNMTAEMITGYFNVLKKGVLKIVNKCSDNCNQPNPEILKQQASVEQQKKLTQFIIKILNVDQNRSRVDESEHPFTTGYGNDVRITTHYLKNDAMGSFYSVFHELGHALYELNLPEEHMWTAVGNSVGLGVHESQSRFVENIIGKGKPFLSYVFPKIQEIIPSFKKIEFPDFLKAVNAVVPSKIRIYADEVTYNLHIIMRFEIERDLFNDKITISELPHAWNEKMEEYLGQKITNDADGGVLQDTHWYGGAFGYFPDYALGNIYDGQFLHTMKKTIPDWEDQLYKGNCAPILNWLDVNVHKKGFLYDPEDLIENVTGEKPNAKYFVDYLTKKFDDIYQI